MITGPVPLDPLLEALILTVAEKDSVRSRYSGGNNNRKFRASSGRIPVAGGGRRDESCLGLRGTQPRALLLAGHGLGPEFLGPLSLSDPNTARSTGFLVLVIILFEGGLENTPGGINRSPGTGSLLGHGGCSRHGGNRRGLRSHRSRGIPGTGSSDRSHCGIHRRGERVLDPRKETVSAFTQANSRG